MEVVTLLGDPVYEQEKGAARNECYQDDGSIGANILALQ